MVDRITVEDIVFHELLRRSSGQDGGAIRHAIEGLRGADQLRSFVGSVLAIVKDLDGELADIEGGPVTTADDAADAALAYAIWDAENTIRMKAECIQEHVTRAKAVRHWLRVHGHHVVRLGITERITMPTEGAPIPLGGLALVHPGDAVTVTQHVGPATASGTNRTDLPAYLPLRKADDAAA